MINFPIYKATLGDTLVSRYLFLLTWGREVETIRIIGEATRAFVVNVYAAKHPEALYLNLSQYHGALILSIANVCALNFHKLHLHFALSLKSWILYLKNLYILLCCFVVIFSLQKLSMRTEGVMMRKHWNCLVQILMPILVR